MLLWAPLRPFILGHMNRFQLPISQLRFSFFHRSSINKTHYRRLTCCPKPRPLSSISSCCATISSRPQPTAWFARGGATTRKFSNRNENSRSRNYHEEDNVSPEHTLIYSNSSVAYYQLAQWFVQPTVFLSIIGAGYLCYISKNDFFLRDNINYAEHPFVAGCVFFVFNSYLFYLVFNVTQSYLLRIYVHLDETNFVAVVPGLFKSHSQLHFTADDVTLSARNVFLPFKRGNSVIKGRSFILHSNDFLIPKFYDILHPVGGGGHDDEK